MARFALIVSGLISLVVGLWLTAAPVAADDPPLLVNRQVVNQRVELLPPGPLCWNVVRSATAAGRRRPPEGYQARALRVSYLLSGDETIAYAGGPTVTARPGEGLFIGANTWHASTNVAAGDDVEFFLTCQQIPPPGTPNVTQLGNTGPLPGVRPGPVPYQVALVYSTGVPGATQDSARITPGPATWYVLQGEVAQSTAAGITRYRAGDLFVNPVGTPFQNTVVSSTDAVFLILQLFPAGEANTLLPSLRLPSPLTPAALPRTGDEVAWLGSLSSLLGLLLVTAGLRLRRTRH